jgi:hypothetical protein
MASILLAPWPIMSQNDIKATDQVRNVKNNLTAMLLLLPFHLTDTQRIFGLPSASTIVLLSDDFMLNPFWALNLPHFKLLATPVSHMHVHFTPDI